MLFEVALLLLKLDRLLLVEQFLFEFALGVVQFLHRLDSGQQAPLQKVLLGHRHLFGSGSALAANTGLILACKDQPLFAVFDFLFEGLYLRRQGRGSALVLGFEIFRNSYFRDMDLHLYHLWASVIVGGRGQVLAPGPDAAEHVRTLHLGSSQRRLHALDRRFAMCQLKL